MPGGIWDWAGGLQTHIKKTLNQLNNFEMKVKKKEKKSKISFFITILHPCALFQNVVHTLKTKTHKVGRHPQTYTHSTSSWLGAAWWLPVRAPWGILVLDSADDPKPETSAFIPLPLKYALWLWKAQFLCRRRLPSSGVPCSTFLACVVLLVLYTVR